MLGLENSSGQSNLLKILVFPKKPSDVGTWRLEGEPKGDARRRASD